MHGAAYEGAAHESFSRNAKEMDKPWLVPSFKGLYRDDKGPVLLVRYVEGKNPRVVQYDESWIMTNFLCDVISSTNLMWISRIVHEDFFLRNFLLEINKNQKVARGCMIDFDRVRCLHDAPDFVLSRWIISVLLAFLMELAFIVTKSTETDPVALSTLLRLSIIHISEPTRPR